MSKRTCSKDDCGRAHCARGLCSRHYQAAVHAGEIVPTGRGAKLCEVVVDDVQCDARVELLTFCRFHYRQQNRGAAFTKRATRRSRGAGYVRDQQGRKQCARCSQWRPLDQYVAATKTLDRLQSWCSPCSSDYMSSARYGMTRADVLDMVTKQGGCAMCGTAEPRNPGFRNGWHVDHDHSCCPTDRTCGRCIRAILCAECNKLIGIAGDSVQRLEQAIVYLAKHKVDE